MSQGSALVSQSQSQGRTPLPLATTHGTTQLTCMAPPLVSGPTGRQTHVTHSG